MTIKNLTTLQRWKRLFMDEYYKHGGHGPCGTDFTSKLVIVNPSRKALPHRVRLFAVLHITQLGGPKHHRWRQVRFCSDGTFVGFHAFGDCPYDKYLQS